MDTLLLSDASRVTAGVLLLALITVESGGLYLTRIVRGTEPATPFQLAFARAGHAHAAVLLILGLVGLLYADVAGLEGLWGTLSRSAIPVAALLLPGGFFFASMGAGRTEPNRFIVLVFAGGVVLAIGLATLGIGLLLAA